MFFVFSSFALSVGPPAPWGPLPSGPQLRYHREELAAFIHFGMNTFTGKEWGEGNEDPNIFKPTNLNTDQWVEVIQNAGFKKIILISRHHDGFCNWRTKYSLHQINASKDFQDISSFLHQSGDVYEEFSKSATKYNMNMGLYLSLWDRNSSLYGSGDEYNQYYINQTKEILGNPKYGNNGVFHEVWMDGAKGTDKFQYYRFPDYFKVINEIQPEAVIFCPYGNTVRWIGNENGIAGETCWSRSNWSRQAWHYDTYNGTEPAYLNIGDPTGPDFSVGECDVSISNNGWYYHKNDSPKTMKELTKIYFSSVGHGMPLLLNIPPNTTGLIGTNMANRLTELGDCIRESFKVNFCQDEKVTATASNVRGNSDEFAAINVCSKETDKYWAMDDDQLTGTIEIDFHQEREIDIVHVSEHLELGQRVTNFSVDAFVNGVWITFGSAHTIGAKHLIRHSPVKATKIRVNIEGSQATPVIESVGAYKGYKDFSSDSKTKTALTLKHYSEKLRQNYAEIITIIGGVCALAAVAIVVTILVSQKKKNQKTINYSIEDDEPLIVDEKQKENQYTQQ